MITNEELKQYLEEIVKRYNAIEERLDRIEQLVMKFWDVPESGFDVVDEESQSIEK